MTKRLDESELRALFEEIGPPAELDARWRERVGGDLMLEEPKPVTLVVPISAELAAASNGSASSGTESLAELSAEPEAESAVEATAEKLNAKPVEKPVVEAAEKPVEELTAKPAENPENPAEVKTPTPTNPSESPIRSAGGPPVFNATSEHRQFENLAESTEPESQQSATIVTLPTERELEPRSHRRRTIAVAAAAAVIVGLGGIVVTSQLLSDSPPADPTMIIDGPDRTVRTSLPSTAQSLDANPPESPTATGPSGHANEPDGGSQVTTGGPVHTNENPGGDGAREPTWPPLVGDPTAANTGVPVTASLAEHHGDLRVSTPGEVVSDLRVTGSIIVDAPNVTLRRVMVVAADGVAAVRQNAGGLTVENSELTGGESITQGAGGLTVRRSRLESGVTVASDAQLTDNYFGGSADILVVSGSTNVSLVHNSVNRVTMNDFDGAIRGVTIQNNLITQVDAPTQTAGSASVHVLGNRFRGSAPSTGWEPTAPDFQWSGNTFASSGAVADP